MCIFKHTFTMRVSGSLQASCDSSTGVHTSCFNILYVRVSGAHSLLQAGVWFDKLETRGENEEQSRSGN